MHTNNPFPTYQVAKYSEVKAVAGMTDELSDYLEEIHAEGDIEDMVQSVKETTSIREYIVKKLDGLKADPNTHPEDIKDTEADLRVTDQLLEFFKQYNLDGLFMNL